MAKNGIAVYERGEPAGYVSYLSISFKKGGTYPKISVRKAARQSEACVFPSFGLAADYAEFLNANSIAEVSFRYADLEKETKK